MSGIVANGIVDWQYDPDVDVLYITLGERQPSYAVEVPDVEGMHIRYSFATNDVTGVVILYYSLQDREELKKHMPFPFNFDVVPN